MAPTVLELYLRILAIFSLCIQFVSPEETQTNTTTTLLIPTRDFDLRLKLSPSSLEGIHEQHIAKVFYELLPVTRLQSHVAGSALINDGITLQIRMKDSHIASVQEPTQLILIPSSNDTGFSNESCIYVKGLFLGRTALQFYIPRWQALTESHSAAPHLNSGGLSAATGPTNYNPNNPTHNPYNSQNTTDIVYTQTVVHLPIENESDDWHQLEDEYYVSVIREERFVDHLFITVIVLIIVLANIGMGCKIDLAVIKEVIRRPIPPGIGLCCQYIIMPLLSFGLVKLLQLEGGVALGMFATGCAPGGGASNMYTYLVKGDVSLSVTMTLISTVSALGLIPFWLFTLGRVILTNEESKRIRIPYTNIIYSLVALLVPVAIGILIQRFKPAWSKCIRKTLRPVFIFFLIFIFTFGVYVNLFIFKLFTGPLVVAGILLPYAGFFSGGLLAFFCKQSWERIKTIAIETGIQNTGVAYLVLTFTLPQPEADLSMVSPIIVATFTPIPLMIAIAIIEYQQRCLKRTEGSKDIQSPIAEEATFDQSAQAKALVNGCQERSVELKQNGSTTDQPLIDNSQGT